LKNILVAIIVFLCISTFAQVQELRQYKSIPEEQIVFNINLNRWSKYPDNMKIEPQSMGIDVYYMYPVVGKNKIFSIAAGAGFSVQNIKSNINVLDSMGMSVFTSIPDTIKYSKNKFSTVYFDIPIEFKLRSRPIVKKRNVKFIIGAKLGVLIQSYQKYEGDNIYHIGTNNKIKYKTYHIKNLLPYHYGVYLRMGYGKFSVTSYMSLSYLFEKNKAMQITPYSIGLAITVF